MSKLRKVLNFLKKIFLRASLNVVSINILRTLIELESQKKLLIDIMNENKFLIIILDACRPDSFRRWISENRPSLLKHLTMVRSEGKTTRSWISNTFSDHKFYLTYVSGNPYINSAGITSVGKIARNCFTEIVDAWKEWNENYETCMPETVNKFTLMNLNKSRLIVHYLQPHQPCIGKIKIPTYLHFKSKWDGFKLTPLQRMGIGWLPPKINQVFSSRNFHEDEKKIIKQAYESNVDLVCSHAFNLIDKFKGTIIVTADHSEMMGENGVWFHNSGHPKLYIVPWLKIINK